MNSLSYFLFLIFLSFLILILEGGKLSSLFLFTLQYLFILYKGIFNSFSLKKFSRELHVWFFFCFDKFCLQHCLFFIQILTVFVPVYFFAASADWFLGGRMNSHNLITLLQDLTQLLACCLKKEIRNFYFNIFQWVKLVFSFLFKETRMDLYKERFLLSERALSFLPTGLFVITSYITYWIVEQQTI